MTSIYMLRHGTTAWNLQKRIQGHTDIPLLAETQEYLRSQQPSAICKSLNWYASPLLRARQTAEALSFDADIAEALIEMNWGEWEGKTLSMLRAQNPDKMAEQEARGVYMTPVGGENPSQVGERITRWLTQLSPSKPMGLVTHKGVIRAAFAVACGWDMLGKPPVRADWNKVFEFNWTAQDGLQLVRVNIELSELC